VRDAEAGELIPGAAHRNEADERDRNDAHDEQGGEHLLPKANPRPTHVPCPPAQPPALLPRVRAMANCVTGATARTSRGAGGTGTGKVLVPEGRKPLELRRTRRPTSGRAHARGGQVATGTI